MINAVFEKYVKINEQHLTASSLHKFYLLWTVLNNNKKLYENVVLKSFLPFLSTLLRNVFSVVRCIAPGLGM